MRWSSSYTRAARRSNAAWSPPLQALNKPVTSADRGSAIAIPQKKVSRPWPVFPFTSARSSGGGTGNEDQTFGCHVGDGGSQPLCRTKRGDTKGNGYRLHGTRPARPDGCPAVGFGDVREHRRENRWSIQELNRFLRHRVGILEWDQRASAIVQQLDRMPVWSRDDRSEERRVAKE